MIRIYQDAPQSFKVQFKIYWLSLLNLFTHLINKIVYIQLILS